MNNYTTVPKSLRRINEEYQGLPIRYVMVLVVMAIICLVLIISTFSAKNKIVPLILLFCVISFFLKFMRKPSVLTRSWLAYKFLIRGMGGHNVVAKYTSTATFMKSIIPIVEFHEAGVIEFTGKQYGLLLKCDPGRISDDELDQHINRVKILADSLHGEIMIKSYTTTTNSTGKPVEKALLASLNEQGRTKEEKAHLYSLYTESTNNSTPVIEWKYYIFVGLGSHATLEDAYISKQQYFPGIIDRLTNANCHIILIQNKNELGRVYRQLMSQISI